MPFKLRSRVAIDAHLPYTKPITHEILTKEKILQSGDVIRTTGSVATDIEGKGSWSGANVTIMVIDDDYLRIKWSRPWSYILFGINDGYWETGTVKGETGKNPLESDGYHTVDEYKLPKAFSWIDEIKIRRLIKESLEELEGIKNVRRETKVVYEPTLPPQSRK